MQAYLGELEKAQWTTLPAPAKGLRLTYGGGEGGECSSHSDQAKQPFTTPQCLATITHTSTTSSPPPLCPTGKSAVFDMQCDPTDPGINDGPTFVGTKDELVYRFAWNTSYACGK
jgi:hypothetical protein